MTVLGLFARRSASGAATPLTAAGQPVTVKRSARATRLSLRLDMASGHPVLSAPANVSARALARFLASQEAWLAQQLAKRPPRVRLVAGARFPYRGREHQVAHEAGYPRSPVCSDREIRLGGPPELVEARLMRWLKSESRTTIAAAAARHAAALGVTVAGLSVRDTKSRWGSCSSAGRLNFSWRLILAPDAVLDYVVAHEVAHRCEMNHSKRFWALVGVLVEDRRHAQAWLKRHGPSLFAVGPPR